MYMLLSLAILTVVAQMETIFCSTESNTDYWIELELQEVHWKPACLTTGGCANPRFRISKSSKFTSEIISVSWSITENFIQKHSRKFITHWVNGEPHDVMLQCDVIGMDPLYGFPRTCDTSQNIEIFREKEEVESNPGGENDEEEEERADDELSISEQRGKLVAEVRAKCFNASFSVQKYMERCPWCPEQEAEIEMALVETANEKNGVMNDEIFEETASIREFTRLLVGEQSLLIFLVVLLVVSVMGLAGLLVVVSKQRHFISALQRRPPTALHHGTRLSSCPYSEKLAAKPSEKSSDERYDIPWEQKCILQPCWIANNGCSSTVISSTKLSNRSSAPALVPAACVTPRRTIIGTATATTSTSSKFLSPNSSLSVQNPEDSGLDSV